MKHLAVMIKTINFAYLFSNCMKMFNDKNLTKHFRIGLEKNNKQAGWKKIIVKFKRACLLNRY